MVAERSKTDLACVVNSFGAAGTEDRVWYQQNAPFVGVVHGTSQSARISSVSSAGVSVPY